MDSIEYYLLYLLTNMNILSETLVVVYDCIKHYQKINIVFIPLLYGYSWLWFLIIWYVFLPIKFYVRFIFVIATV